MPRRKLTDEQQLKGVRAALRSRRTPPQLRAGLERRAGELEKMLEAEGKKPRKSGQHGSLHHLLGI